MPAANWPITLACAAALMVVVPATIGNAETSSYVSTQWNIASGRADSTYGVHADQAWTTTAGAGAIIGVIDIGFLDHADLADKYLPGYDFITDASSARDGDGRDPDPADEGNYYAQDDQLVQQSSWHGLHVAGTVAGGLSDADAVGVAPAAKILPLRVGGTAAPTVADMTAAIRWGAGLSVDGLPDNPYPADALNLSIAEIGACPDSLQAAIDAATQAGTAVVVAAGNTWNTLTPDPLSVNYPANCRNVVRVTASDYTGHLTSFSNRGTDAYPATIAAPGASIRSTWNTGTTLPVAGGDTYQSLAGTSMSAPHVAGVLALLRAARPDLSVDQLVASVTATAQQFPDAADAATGGAGIVDAPSALASALSLPISVPSPTPTDSTTPSPSATPSDDATPTDSSTPTDSATPTDSTTPSPSTTPSEDATPSASTTPSTGTAPSETAASPSPQPPITQAPRRQFVGGARPKAKGTYRVGHKLRASVGTWSPTPTSYTYRWLRNGKKITGATKSTYKLTRSDRHKRISVKITVKRTGYTTTSATSSSHKIA
jgi:serine protease